MKVEVEKRLRKQDWKDEIEKKIDYDESTSILSIYFNLILRKSAGNWKMFFTCGF